MYDIRALGRVLHVGALALAAVFLINMVFVLVSATYPNWLPRQFFGVDFLADNRQRVVAAGDHYASDSAAEPLVVVLGLSSASEGRYTPRPTALLSFGAPPAQPESARGASAHSPTIGSICFR